MNFLFPVVTGASKLISLVLMLSVAKVLGKYEYALLSQVSFFLTYVLTVNFGLPTFYMVRIGRYAGRNLSSKKVTDTIVACSLALTLIIGLLLMPLFSNNDATLHLLAIALLLGISRRLIDYAIYFFEGHGKFLWSIIARTMIGCVVPIIGLFTVILFEDLCFLLILQFCALFVGGLVFWLFIIQYNLSTIRFSIEYGKLVFVKSWPLFLCVILSLLMRDIDRFIIMKFYDSEIFADFSFALTLVASSHLLAIMWLQAKAQLVYRASESSDLNALVALVRKCSRDALYFYLAVMFLVVLLEPTLQDILKLNFNDVPVIMCFLFLPFAIYTTLHPYFFVFNARNQAKLLLSMHIILTLGITIFDIIIIFFDASFILVVASTNVFSVAYYFWVKAIFSQRLLNI